MRTLLFDIKRNLKKAPRIHVKSSETGISYGSFLADAPDTFTGWERMNEKEVIELKHYMDNLNAVKQHLGEHALNEQADYRLRLPLRLMGAIEEISQICHRTHTPLDCFEPAITSIIQSLKVATTKLQGDDKTRALACLDRIGLAEYKKMDDTHTIKAIFSELLGLHNKSEKLHQAALELYDKDKSYSPRAIESMATGKSTPSKWLVSCAIDALLAERRNTILALLSNDNLQRLWAKPLLDHGQATVLSERVALYQLELIDTTTH